MLDFNFISILIVTDICRWCSIVVVNVSENAMLKSSRPSLCLQAVDDVQTSLTMFERVSEKSI